MEPESSRKIWSVRCNQKSLRKTDPKKNLSVSVLAELQGTDGGRVGRQDRWGERGGAGGCAPPRAPVARLPNEIEREGLRQELLVKA